MIHGLRKLSAFLGPPDEKLAKPVLVGRPTVIERRLERFGLRMRPGVDFEIVNPEWDERYRRYWQEYHLLTERKGVTEQYAQIVAMQSVTPSKPKGLPGQTARSARRAS